MLYHSPPVLHPSKTLVVWPLRGGDRLFGDYSENTYFVRGSMTATGLSKKFIPMILVHCTLISITLLTIFELGVYA
jgi:hypothetical protein